MHLDDFGFSLATVIKPVASLFPPNTWVGSYASGTPNTGGQILGAAVAGGSQIAAQATTSTAQPPQAPTIGMGPQGGGGYLDTFFSPRGPSFPIGADDSGLPRLLIAAGLAAAAAFVFLRKRKVS